MFFNFPSQICDITDEKNTSSILHDLSMIKTRFWCLNTMEDMEQRRLMTVGIMEDTC